MIVRLSPRGSCKMRHSAMSSCEIKFQMTFFPWAVVYHVFDFHAQKHSSRQIAPIKGCLIFGVWFTPSQPYIISVHSESVFKKICSAA